VSDFPEPTSFNGLDMREIGTASKEDARWVCLDCGETGHGYVSRGRHWYATEQGHRIVAGFDPRAKAGTR